MSSPEMNNEAFIEKSKLAFETLFEAAKQKNELHFSSALIPGSRPYQYNASLETDAAFEQYLEFLRSNDYPKIKPRIALAFYCHLAEASGYWEVIKNMLCIANGECYTLPFSEFAKKHKESGKIIAPNANKVFKSIAGLANELGNQSLAEVLRDAYNPDIRNGFSHADYILLEKGIAFNNRYGKEHIMPWSEINMYLQRGIQFYFCLNQTIQKYLKCYSNEKAVMGQLNGEPIQEWYIFFDEQQGLLKIKNMSFK